MPLLRALIARRALGTGRPARVPAAGLAAAIAVALSVAGLGAAPAAATNLAKESVTPSAGLASGQKVTVSISEFPANTAVGIVECDERVVTSGDAGYCESADYADVTTSSSGTATATFTVYSGSAFSSTNGKGVCDRTTPCYVVASTYKIKTDPTSSLYQVTFSGQTLPSTGTSSDPDGGNTGYVTPSTTPAGGSLAVSPRHATVKAGSPVTVKVSVFGATGVSAPTGSVALLDHGRTLAVSALSSADTATLRAKLAVGHYRLTVRYGGDTNYAASSKTVTVTVVSAKAHRKR